MNTQQLENLQKSIQEQHKQIEIQKKQLLDDQIIFNLYQKISFFRDNFDTDSSIKIMTRENSKNQYGLLFVIGYTNNFYRVIDCEELSKKTDIYFYKPFKFEHREIFITNNPEGYEKLLKTALQDEFTYYNSLILEKQLTQKTSSGPSRKI